jgi:YegS/Rv2252/BmrU family lipid kinase
MKKICIIFNPKAGNSKLTRLNKIIAELNKNNAVTLFETSVAGDATNIARTESANFDIIVAAGGDGTINEVVNGINSNTPLAIIPMGTANIVAIEAGISNSNKVICDAINAGKTKKVYVSNINNKKFILMTGIGYDAKVVSNINPKLKKMFGKIIFFLEGLKQFFKLKEFNITVTSNNQTHNANWVLITNAKHYAGSYSITKRTNIFKEDLVCYLFQDLTKLSFLYNLFLIVFYGDLSKSKKIKTIQSNVFKIHSEQKTPIQCDGEPFGHLPVTIQSNKEFLNLITV